MSSIIIKSNFDLNKLSPDLIWEITEIWLYNSSELAIKQAREFAPYKTWRLKAWIWREPAMIWKKTKKVMVWPRKIDYAITREFNNRKNPDKKFYMKKTWEKLDTIVENEFEKAVNIVLKHNWLI